MESRIIEALGCLDEDTGSALLRMTQNLPAIMKATGRKTNGKERELCNIRVAVCTQVSGQEVPNVGLGK